MHHCALKILFTTFISAIFVEGLHLTHRGELPLKRKAPIPPNEDTLNELKGILRKRVLDDNQMEFSQYLKDEKEALLALEAGLEDKLQKFASGLAFEADFYASISSSVKQSSNGFDPFRVCKFSELVREETKCYISDISTKLLDFTDETLMTETLEQVLELSLWGTRREILDLSPKPELSAAEKNAAAFGNNVQFAVSEEKKRRMSPKMKKAMFNNVLQDNQRLIYKNFASVDTDSIYQVVEFLRSIRFDETSLANEDNRKVHIITDKAGHGLVADLLLGHVLLCLNICSSVSYHCRPYSSGSVLSVTGADISGTIEEMADPQKGGDLWNVRHFGEALTPCCDWKNAY